MGAVSIDVLASTLWHTLLNPILATVPAATVGARGVSSEDPLFRWLVFYAIGVVLFRLLLVIDAYFSSPAPRPLKWSDEVVLIAGGNGGLGSVLAEVFAIRGISTAVVDVAPATTLLRDKWEDRGCSYYSCDVSSDDAVSALHQQVCKDLGNVTVLINAAAVVNGKPFLSLSSTELLRTYSINVVGQHRLVSAFLPAMSRRAEGGTIVTVSSVLGGLGAAGLSGYCSSKGALSALHASLQAELRLQRSSEAAPGTKNMRTILVKPGQLGTQMFASVRPHNEFLGPTVSTAELAREIVKAIDSGRDAEICMPFYARWIAVLYLLPYGLQRFARWMAGLDYAGWTAYSSA